MAKGGRESKMPGYGQLSISPLPKIENFGLKVCPLGPRGALHRPQLPAHGAIKGRRHTTLSGGAWTSRGCARTLRGGAMGPLCGNPSDLFGSPFVVIDFFESFGNFRRILKIASYHVQSRRPRNVQIRNIQMVIVCRSCWFLVSSIPNGAAQAQEGL